MIVDTLPDIPRELTGLAEWAACLVYILILPKRLPTAVVAGILALGLAALVSFQAFAGTLPIWMWTVGMAGAVVIMLGLIICSAKVALAAAGYFAARALVLAELLASLEWQLASFFFPVDDGAPPSSSVVGGHLAMVLGVYAVGFGLAHVIEARHLPRTDLLDITGKDLVIAVATALGTFFVSNLSFISADTPFSGRLSNEIFYIRTLVNLCGFAALYAQQEQRLDLRRRVEVEAMNHLLRSQHEQYLHSQRSIQQVNRRHHDLKHQMAAIRAEADPLRKSLYIDELEGIVRDYDRQVQTGNPVLDTLLTAKNMEATESGIMMTAVADGAILGGIRPIDLATILGNGLDNAIEGAKSVRNAEQRLIRVAVYAQGSLAMIRIENSFGGELRWSGDELLSSKTEPQDHGYGLSSIRGTAEAYGGASTVSAQDDWFTLRVLLPIHPSGAS